PYSRPLKLFTGSPGVSPAASAKREQDAGEASSLQDQSRLTALPAGETPALPVKSLSDTLLA
ncbi:MAG: hypothetical protein M3R52_07065, partial [Acidobacteriota bacterium]|nr:hypothetical protein [Acidobacteriota bacterium]